MSPQPNRFARVISGALIALTLVLAGCGGGTSSEDTRYGGSQNHLHGILALRGLPGTVVVASHVGFYRSDDAGAHWAEVAGLAGQPMAGLMLAQVIQSIANPQTLYVLAISRADGPQVAQPQPGMYVSHDAGRTWAMATPLASFPVPQIYALGAGSASVGDVYAISRANETVYHTTNGGQTWAQVTAIPIPQGIVGAGGHAAFAWSITEGFYRSTDDGATWHAAAGLGNGIYAAAPVGQTVYACGNDGVFASGDGGAHFTLVAAGLRFTTVVASAAEPMRVYGLSGTGVQMSSDGGHTWQPLAATTRHPGNLTVDPTNAHTLYAGFSYPIGLDRTTDGGAAWQSVLP